MSFLPVCQLSNVFANQQAFALIENFCSCPEAKNILTQLQVPLYFQVGKFPYPARTETTSDNLYKPKKSLITISKSDPEATQINNVSFELFNALADATQKRQNFFLSAEKGEIGMDDYARTVEESEFNVLKKSGVLNENCHFWGFKQKLSLSDRTVMKNLNAEEILWQQDLECHTDKIRLRWIDRFKTAYCQKRPEDHRSCETEKSQLCDRYEVNQLPEKQRSDFLDKRLCERFPSAPQKLQDLFSILIVDKCPEVL